MDPKESELFTGQDFQDFTNWLNLKDFSDKWEVKVHNELESFYLLFLSGVTDIEGFQARKKIAFVSFNEPLRKWLDWFLGKLSIYHGIFKNLSIAEILEKFEIEMSVFINLLYQHFSETGVQYHKEKLTEEYLYSHPEIDISSICMRTEDLRHLKEECKKHPVYSTLDFTFYPEWKKCLEKLRNFSTPLKNEKVVLKDYSIKNFFYEFLIIFISIAVSLGVFKVGNKFYNNYLSNKIEIYEPNFFWLNKNLTFKSEKKSIRHLNLSQDELDKLENEEKISTPFINEERETPESEVFVLTSDNIPKNLKYISGEKSRYEEIQKGGFRDKAYGRKKAYRIILNSVEMDVLKEKIKKITSKYKTEEFGKVAMGQEIPGGSYFNLYVKEMELNDFLEEVVSLDSSSRLYVSKTNAADGPDGFEKVFIWIKSI